MDNCFQMIKQIIKSLKIVMVTCFIISKYFVKQNHFSHPMFKQLEIQIKVLCTAFTTRVLF